MTSDFEFRLKIEMLKVKAVVEFDVQVLRFRRNWLPPSTGCNNPLFASY
jgi:hypothetical protein